MSRSMASIAVVAAALAILIFASTVAAAIPPVPYFSQCDSRWGSDRLGGDGPTICSMGCALTSAAMVAAYYGADTDPQRLNDAIGRGKFADQSVAFGEPHDLPVIGDWDGDCDDNIGVYMSSSGEFFMDVTVPDVSSGSKTIYVDDDFIDDPANHTWDTIQEGVDDASDGDTVIVYAGEYCENVDVNKRVRLIGEDKNTTFVSGGGNEDVIRVTSDGCTISGFTIQSRESSIVDMVEIRGEVAAGSFTWTPVNFAGFYYDIDADVGNETLTIITDSDRMVEEGDLVYKTTPDMIDFEYSGWGGYQVIGFMAEKYFAGYDGTETDDEITEDGTSLISNNMLSKVLIDDDNDHAISTGASLQLEEGYELKAIQLDVNANKAQFKLLHNGEHVNTTNVTAPDTYVYKKNLGTVNDVPIIAIHIGSVFAGTETDMVEIDGVFQSSDDYVSIEPRTDFGAMEVKSVSSSAITLENEESVNLCEDCTERIIGDLYIVTADNDTLRFYPVVEHTEPGVFEVRGEVQYVAGANPETVWNARNFSGFYYDPDEDTSTETLSVAANTINCSAGDRIIDENRLTYRTVSVAKTYELYENKGCTVKSSDPGGDSFYWNEGWMGERYVAIDNKANKLCKLLVEFTSSSDKKTMATGEAWDLGRGFALTAKEIDLGGNSVWLSLSKNGNGLDNQIINTDTGNEQDRVYTYTANIGGEEAIPVFSCYVDALFRGTDSNLIQVKYVFLIDDLVLEIEAGDRYGAMEVITTSSSEIILKNDETAIDLDAGTTVPIMDPLYFRVADDGTTIGFYPFVEKVIGSSQITEIAGIGLDSTDNNTLTDNKIRLSDCGIHLQDSNNNTLVGNDINSNNEYGIYLSSSSNNTIACNTANRNCNCGIVLHGSESNNVTGNIANDNGCCGIKIDSSSSNMLVSNIANLNRWDGIDLWYSSNNTLTGNMISDNKYNFGLYGWNDAHFDNNIDTTNLVDGKPIYYIKDTSDLIINSTIDAGTIYCIGCDNITVKDVILTNNGAGVFFWDTSNSTIEDVNISKNDYGIYLGNSSNNTLTGSIAFDNSRGIEVCNSSDNMLTNTDVLDNWGGISLSNSDGNNLTGNNASYNIGYSIELQNSGSNILTSNTISNNWAEGISLRYSSSNDLISNIVSGNGDGINLWNSGSNLLNKNTASGNDNGIYLGYSNSNTLIDNSVDMNNWNGIDLWCSNNNTFTDNTANSNNKYGIHLSFSSNNTLTDNAMSGNIYNLRVYGNSLSDYVQNIDPSNTVEGKPIYYWVDYEDMQIPCDAGFVGVVNSTNITVRDLTLTKNYEGVLFAYTKNSRIGNVTASDNSDGIYLYSSSNNTLTNSTANSNERYGILLKHSSDNTLTNNTANSNHFIHGIGYGIYLSSSSSNTLTGNNASNNRYGLYLRSSSNNTLSSNTANSNERYGILLKYSSDNTLTNNTANSNHFIHGIGYGIYLASSSNNTLMSNNCSNNNVGIDLSSSSNNMLASNNASNNYYGIYLYRYSSNNTILDNIASSNWCGIYPESSDNNELTKNNASSNDWGIYLDRSSNNDLTGNIMSENDHNFGVHGNRFSHFIQNIDTSNLVDKKPIYYWVAKRNLQIPDDAGFVGVVNSTNITVKELTLTNNSAGVLFAYTNNSRIENVTVSNNGDGIIIDCSSNNTLVGNNASNNYYGIVLSSSGNNTLIGNIASNNYYGSYPYGIYAWFSSGISLFSSSNNIISNNIANSNHRHGFYLGYSSNNTLTNNSVLGNDYYGIYLRYSSNNTLYHNNLVDNTQNAYDTNTNQWDSGSEGNYYSDYNGTDPDGDGIGEDPYSIPGGGGSVDNYPLMQPWAGGTWQKGDLNGDNQITSADAAIALAIAAGGGSASCDAATLAAADVSGDGRVTSLDALMILQAAGGWTEIEEPPISNIDVDSIEGWRGGSNSSAGDMDTFSEELYRLDMRCSLKCGSDPADMSQTVITIGCGMTTNDLRYIHGEINTTDGMDAPRLADDVNKVGTYFRLEVRDGTADGKCPLYYFQKAYPDAYESDNVVYSSTGTDLNNRIGIKSGGVYFARCDKFYSIDEIRDVDNSFTKDNPMMNTGDLVKIILFTGPEYLDNDLDVTAIHYNETSIDANELANALTADGWVMYGTDQCGWCIKQKEEFSDAFENITYINCMNERQKCIDAGVQGIPCWGSPNGTLYPGYRNLTVLLGRLNGYRAAHLTAIHNNETMGESSLTIDTRSSVVVQITSEGDGSTTTVDFVTPCSYGTYAYVDLYP